MIDVSSNTASNVLHSSVFVWNVPFFPSPVSPCHVNVSGLETNGGGGVFWWQFGNGTQYTGVLTDNIIRQKPDSSYAGFELWDGGNSRLLVSQNKVHGEGAFIWGPLFAFDVRDAVISNNLVTGSGPAAAYLGIPVFGGESVTGLTLLGNNFQRWSTDGGPFPGFPGVAPIWLGPATYENTVIGGANSTNVFDEGVNNTIVGVNNMGTNIGQDIRDAMLQRMEAKRTHMELDAALR